METIKAIPKLKSVLDGCRQRNAKIGFVPTMGALHGGHLSLVRESIRNNEITVVSIYVNPSQFNNENDLKNYPRNFDKDCEVLAKENVSFVFAPTDQEMYPEPDTRVFDFHEMGTVMEGKFRPGHFNGVAQIVSKLFDVVEPDRAYFGEKDFQQLAIVRQLVVKLGYKIEIIGCPIVRENDGLAMSSRNQLLTKEQRRAAPLIYLTLKAAKAKLLDENIETIGQFVKETINKDSHLELEYFVMVNSNTLIPIPFIDPVQPTRACIAVYANPVRLIDNMDFIS